MTDDIDNFLREILAFACQFQITGFPHHMAAARDRRCKQQGRCTAADALWGVLWCAVWLWFAARTLGTARRILACQQFGTACRRALYAGARAQRLQW